MTSPTAIATLHTNHGAIKVNLFGLHAPKTVENFEGLATGSIEWRDPRSGEVQTGKPLYNGVIFHRIIQQFMLQGGDPTGTGMGGSKLPDIKAEFTPEPFKRGTVGMARSSDPDSGNSQFFVMFAPGDFLNGQYTVWGQVDETGMACVDQIARGEPPATPDKMIKVTVE